MTKRSLPTPEELRQLLRYEPETGKLYWKPRPEEKFATVAAARAWNARFAYKEAFTTMSTKGYRKGLVNYRQLYAQSVAWAIYYGEWTEEKIDFRNTVKTDTRISNLRIATNSECMKNRGPQKNNKSGYKGVHQRSDTRKWSASIWSDGVEINLGSRFTSAEAAHAAYCEAAKKYHGEFARTE